MAFRFNSEAILAASPTQLTVSFACFFICLQLVCNKVVENNCQAFDTQQKRRISLLPTSQIHAILACGLAIYGIYGPDGYVLAQDPVNGTTDISKLVMTFSTGYFLYDFWVISTFSPVDYKFLLHAIVCGICSWLTQAPFCQYYALRYLLFELSTPFLNMMHVSNLFEKAHTFKKIAKASFAISFVSCRILYGIPLCIDFCTFCWSRMGKVESAVGLYVLYFSIFASVSMTMLNVSWLWSNLPFRNKIKQV